MDNRVKSDRLKAAGQGLVEFMLILPILLLILFMIVEIARVLHAWLAIENGARFGLRYAVTNQYDDKHCPMGGCLTETDEDAARIASIREAAEYGSSSILRNLSETDWAAPTYFEVTICSKDINYTEPHPANFTTDWTADCAPADEAGDAGDLVWVTVDFNHPVISPFLSSIWPQLHLTSRRDGVVESFRTVRFVGAGPFTPAPTNTPTDTPIPPTDTPTPCRVPPVVDIIDPAPGAVFNSGDNLGGQATAYDPDNADPVNCAGVGPDGDGIVEVQFRVFWDDGGSWEWMYGHNESAVAYCAMSGDAPCDTIEIGAVTSWPDTSNTIMSGLHRMEARARDDEGVWSGWDAVEFTINAPPTPTPTNTPIPSCDGVSFGGFSFEGSQIIEQTIWNTTYPGLELVGLTVYWDPLEAGSDLYGWNERIDWIEWNNVDIRTNNDSSSPTSANINLPRDVDQGSNEIEVDFDGGGPWRLNNYPANLDADNFGFDVHFSDPECDLSSNADWVNWPPPTITPTASNTPQPTNTRPPTNTPAATNTSAATNTPRPSNTPRPPNTPTNTPPGPPTNTPPTPPTNTPEPMGTLPDS